MIGPAIAFAASPQSAVRAGRLSVELARDLVLQPDDRAALESLIERRPETGVFLSPAWLSGFFADPPAGATLSLALLRDGGRLSAVVPLAIRETLGHVHVSLVGGGAGSDRVDLLCTDGLEAQTADAFLAWLGDMFDSRGFVLELRDVPASSPLWGAIQRAVDERTLRLVVQPKEINTLPYLALGGASPAESGDARAARTSLEKHRRWLEHKCRLRIERLDRVDEVTSAFADLSRFLQARWRGHATGSALDRPGKLQFHRRALPRLLEEGRLRMIRLTGDGRTIAVFYGLAAGRWWGYYLAGYDREWAGRIRLGQIALASAIDLASAEGASDFDFLKGTERIKYSWPVRERITLDADVFSATAGVQFLRAHRAARDTAAALAKSARGLIATSLGL